MVGGKPSIAFDSGVLTHSGVSALGHVFQHSNAVLRGGGHGAWYAICCDMWRY